VAVNAKQKELNEREAAIDERESIISAYEAKLEAELEAELKQAQGNEEKALAEQKSLLAAPETTLLEEGNTHTEKVGFFFLQKETQLQQMV
jgi:hypothetical protein